MPVGNLLGEENKGFSYLIRNLPQERLVIAVRAAMGMEVMLERTVAYAKERQAFGQSVIDFQHNRFKLAEAKAQAAMFRVFADHCLALHLRGELTVELAAAAKLLGAEMQNRLFDDFLQMHGGYGYMAEYEIGRAWADARVGRIYGGGERDHEGDHRPHAVDGRAARRRRTTREASDHGFRSPRRAGAALGRARGAARPACAQERFPSRPITVLVPFPPGGATDVQMRAMAEAATRAFGQTVLVENKPGAGSTLGASTGRARAAGRIPGDADDPALPAAALDAAHALRPAHGLHADHPPHRLPVRRGGARRRALPDVAGPGGGCAAAAGPGARRQHRRQRHAAPDDGGPRRAREAGCRSTSRSAARATRAPQLLGGHIEALAAGSGAGQLVNEGKLRFLNFWARERSERWPEVPTLLELGYQGMVVTSPYGLCGPAKHGPGGGRRRCMTGSSRRCSTRSTWRR